MKRVEDKIEEITKFLEELITFFPIKFEDYEKNIEKKAACERYFEKIIEAVVDLAFLIIKLKQFNIPQDDADAFRILLENKVINNELQTKLKYAKGMRNIIVHEYGEINDKLIFNSISEELETDVMEFIENIKSFLKPTKQK